MGQAEEVQSARSTDLACCECKAGASYGASYPRVWGDPVGSIRRLWKMGRTWRVEGASAGCQPRMEGSCRNGQEIQVLLDTTFSGPPSE